MSDRIDVSATITVNDQASSAIARVRNSLAGISDAAQKVGQDFLKLGTWKNFTGGVTQLGASLGKLRGAFMGLAKPVMALVGIGGGIGIAEAVRGMESYVASVRALSREAPVLGTTVERLSELRYAASRAGVSAEEMNSAFSRANVAIAKAATGKGTELTNLFGKLGISLRDSNGHIRSTATMMDELADAFARQTDPVVKLRMATELFGRAAGPDMLKLLGQGAEGIAQFVAQGREMGLIISDEKAEEAKRFAAAQAEVKRVWQGLSTQLSQNLLPVLQPLVEHFGRVLNELRPTLVEALTEAFTALAEALKAIDWEATVKSAIEWVRWINDVVNATVGWKGVLAAFATFLAGPMIAAMISVGAAVAQLSAVIGAAMLANPILAVIAALAAGGLLIWKNWDGISDFFSGTWDKISDGAEGAWDGITDIFGDIGERLGGMFNADALRAAWEGVTAFFQDLWDGVRAVFDTLIDWLGPFANLFAPLAIYKNWDALAGFFQGVWDQVTTIFERAWAIIKPIIDALRDGIGWILEKMPSLSGVSDTAASIGRTIFNAPGNAVDWVGGKLGGLFGGGRADDGRSVVAAAQPSIVERATAAQAPARVDGEVDVNIHMTGAPEGTTVATRERGQVRATGDVGMSMAAPA